MKLIKLTSDHYIVVDDSEMKHGDFRFNIQRGYYKEVDADGVRYYNKRNDVFKKITHSTQQLENEFSATKFINYNFIPLSEVEEAIYGYSVQKMAKEYTEKRNYLAEEEQGYLDGFKAHQELVKDKLFTVDDMKGFVKYLDKWWRRSKGGWYHVGDFYKNDKPVKTHLLMDKYLESLPSKTEWDVKFNEQGKLELL